MRKLFNIVWMASVILALASCQHKELCYDHSHVINVDITFDWTKAPDAQAESMSLYLFSEEGTDPQRYEFVGKEGGTIRVVPGVYHAICLNSDTEEIAHRNTDHFSTYTLTTEATNLLAGMSSLGLVSSSAPRVKGTEDQSVKAPSEKLWTDQMTLVEFTEQTTEFTMAPKATYRHVILEILNVENLQYAASVSGALSGLADGYMIGLGELSKGLATVPFPLIINKDENKVTGDFYTFGHCPAEMNTHIFTIYVIMRDGSKWYYTCDVTDKMHNADNHIIRITIDTLPIPQPQPDDPSEGGGGGGFMPTVDDWNTINIGINM